MTAFDGICHNFIDLSSVPQQDLAVAALLGGLPPPSRPYPGSTSCTATTDLPGKNWQVPCSLASGKTLTPSQHTEGPPFCFGCHFMKGLRHFMKELHHFMSGSCHFVKHRTALCSFGWQPFLDTVIPMCSQAALWLAAPSFVSGSAQI